VHVAEGEDAASHREYRGHLGGREHGLHAPAEHDTQAVDHREHGDHRHGDQLPHAELEHVRHAGELQRVLIPARLEAVDVGNEDGDRRAVGGHRRSAEHEGVAGEQESRHLAVRGAQVDILSARVRQQRAELGETQRAQHGDAAGGDPRGQHQQRRPDRLRHARRLEEDTRADDDADDQRGGVNECQVAARLEGVLVHGRIVQLPAIRSGGKPWRAST
jgi:hypothetical protein